MGKSTISMVIFNSYVTNYQRVISIMYQTSVFPWTMDEGFPLPAAASCYMEWGPPASVVAVDCWIFLATTLKVNKCK
jgi:hypothetical protein